MTQCVDCGRHYSEYECPSCTVQKGKMSEPKGLKIQDGSVLYSESENNKIQDEIARLKEENKNLLWWKDHGQKLRNAILTHLMDLPGKSAFEIPTGDQDVEAQPEKTAKELARLTERVKELEGELTEAGANQIRQNKINAKEIARLKVFEQVCYDLHQALGVKWGDDPYAEIRRLKAENERLIDGINRANERERESRTTQRTAEIALSTAENELDKLRKVVWWLQRGHNGYCWVLTDTEAKANNIDIPALKKGMGQEEE